MDAAGLAKTTYNQHVAIIIAREALPNARIIPNTYVETVQLLAHGVGVSSRDILDVHHGVHRLVSLLVEDLRLGALDLAEGLAPPNVISLRLRRGTTVGRAGASRLRVLARASRSISHWTACRRGF